MPVLTAKAIKNDARLVLAVSHSDHRRIVWIYSLIALGAPLLSALVYFVTDLMIASTGGLSGLGTRTVLLSIQTITELLINLLLPLWTLGLSFCAIRLSRQDPVAPKALTAGFSRWGVALRLALAQGVVYLAVIYLTAQIASLLFSFSPMSAKAVAAMEPLLADGTLTQAQALSLLKLAYPMLIIWGVLLLVSMIPLVYSFRMCAYRILDEDRPGALISTLQSRRMMKGNRLKLFKLDLSFWWFYVLVILAAILTYVPFSLLPISDSVAFLCSTALHSAVVLLLYKKYILYMETCYALFYDRLLQYHRAKEQAPTPPWQQ